MAGSKGFSGVSSILGGIKVPKAVRDHLKYHAIWSKWHEIVGFELSRVTSPSELKGSTLEINVAHQAWAQQLHFLKPSILGKIRSYCPGLNLKDLAFHVGTVVPPIVEGKTERAKTTPVPVKLSERQEMTLRAVEDPELRAVIRKAMEAEAQAIQR